MSGDRETLFSAPCLAGVVPMPEPVLRLRTVPQDAWVLVERYVEHFPDDWRLVFRRAEEVLEVSVAEDVWRAFDA